MECKKLRLFPIVSAMIILTIGCEKDVITLDNSPLSGSVEIVNRTSYDVERISYFGKEKNALVGSLISAGAAQYVQCPKMGPSMLSVVKLRVFCHGRWSKLILWSEPKQNYYRLRSTWPISFVDEYGNSSDENGKSYLHYINTSFNQTLYVEDWGGDIVLTNRQRGRE